MKTCHPRVALEAAQPTDETTDCACIAAIMLARMAEKGAGLERTRKWVERRVLDLEGLHDQVLIDMVCRVVVAIAAARRTASPTCGWIVVEWLHFWPSVACFVCR